MAIGVALAGAVALAWHPGPARAAAPGRIGGPYLGIVLADPQDRLLGAAGASCGLRDAVSMATIDPSSGAVVAEPASPASTEAALVWLGGQGAVPAIGTATAAVRAGAPRPAAHGPGTRIGASTAAIGAGLRVHGPAAAVRAAEGGGTPVERLLAALDAAWPPDACAGRPSAAFLVVTRPGEDLIAPGLGLPAARRRTKGVIAQLGGSLAADEVADRLLDAAALPHPQGPGAPDVYLSLMQPPTGFDVVPLLRQAFEQASSPAPSSSPSGPGGASAPGSPAGSASGGGVEGRLAVGALIAGLLIAVVGIGRRLRQMNEDA
jgi:hypothetical protein